ncbi:MAG: alpha/beta hydrolase [Vicinamibacterales bacterium]
MPTEFLKDIAGPVGRLEARLDLPTGAARAVAVCAHPHPLYGGTMHTKALYQAAKALTRTGVAALRFNFRGVGLSGGTFDAGPGEKDDFRAAVDFAAARFPGVPIWAVGMSFGSWIAGAVGAEDPRVSLVVLIAPPVDRYDFTPLAGAGRPVFVVHGEDDELIPAKDVRAFYATLAEPKELVMIEDANHLFENRTPLVGDAVEGLAADFQG